MSSARSARSARHLEFQTFGVIPILCGEGIPAYQREQGAIFCWTRLFSRTSVLSYILNSLIFTVSLHDGNINYSD